MLPIRLPGNVFEKTLLPGEQFDVEPGGWLYLTAEMLGGCGWRAIDLLDRGESGCNRCRRA
jgi:hypothetical protein